MGFLVGMIFIWSVCGTTFAATRPNILFCIADDVSYPHMGAYGTKWVTTPGFDLVAREGLLFTRAYTPNAKCAPSRSCILTGRNSWQLKEAANHWPYFPAEFKTYAESLAEHGYFVGMTGKGCEPMEARDAMGKPRSLAGRPFNEKRTTPPARHISSTDYAANFEEFLSEAPKGKPWCFWYGAREPHRAYEFGVGIEQGGKSLSDIAEVPPYWPDSDDVRTDMLDYAFEIEHFDKHVVRMLDMLERSGQLNKTLVIVTSDNGMPFPRVKSDEYEASNHLPLAMMWKEGIKEPGRVVDDYVSFIDFAPTFVELAGLQWEETGMQSSPGRSLTDIFDSGSGATISVRDHVLIGKERHDVGRPYDWGYPIRGIVKGDLLYLRNFEPDRWPAGNPETGYLTIDGSPTKSAVLNLRRSGDDWRYWQLSFGKRPTEELYDLSVDPHCVSNLADSSPHAEAKQRLSEQLVRELKEQGDPRMFGQGQLFDQYRYSDERSRNFYERFMNGDQPKSGWVNDSDFEEHPIDREADRSNPSE